MDLPRHIIDKILNVAILPIDTRLEFGIKPKKIKTNKGLKRKLNAMFAFRIEAKSKKDCMIDNLFNTVSNKYGVMVKIQMTVYYLPDQIVYQFKTLLRNCMAPRYNETLTLYP